MIRERERDPKEKTELDDTSTMWKYRTSPKTSAHLSSKRRSSSKRKAGIFFDRFLYNVKKKKVKIFSSSSLIFISEKRSNPFNYESGKRKRIVSTNHPVHQSAFHDVQTWRSGTHRSLSCFSQQGCCHCSRSSGSGKGLRYSKAFLSFKVSPGIS